MPADPGIQSGVSGTGSRGIGVATRRISRGGNDKRLRCHARSGAGVRVWGGSPNFELTCGLALEIVRKGISENVVAQVLARMLTGLSEKRDYRSTISIEN